MEQLDRSHARGTWRARILILFLLLLALLLAVARPPHTGATDSDDAQLMETDERASSAKHLHSSVRVLKRKKRKGLRHKVGDLTTSGETESTSGTTKTDNTADQGSLSPGVS